MLFIGLNMLTMTMDHYHQTDIFTLILDYLNMIFICIFSTECLMKIFALRYHYFVEPWNLFDVVVVVLSILSTYGIDIYISKRFTDTQVRSLLILEISIFSPSLFLSLFMYDTYIQIIYIYIKTIIYIYSYIYISCHQLKHI